MIIATKILIPLYSSNPFMSYNRLKILKGWLTILSNLQKRDHNIFDIFKPVEAVPGHFFTLREVLFTFFDLYSIWYTNLKKASFKGLFMSSRRKNILSAEIKFMSYGVLALVNKSQKPENALGKTKQRNSFFHKAKFREIFDIVSTNCIKYVAISEKKQQIDIHAIRYETKMLG